MRRSSWLTIALWAGILLSGLAATARAETALWLRYPAISPDGSTIAFSYRGDLWRVPVGGGQATQLTVHTAHDRMPVWSPDGSRIASPAAGSATPTSAA